MQEIEEPRASLRRILYITGVFILFFAGNVILAVKNRMLLDELFCTLILNVVFLCIFVICVIRSRVSGRLGYQGTDYSRLFVYLIAGWVLAVTGAYIGDFLMPIGFMAFVFCSYFTLELAMGMELYFAMTVCLLCGRGTYPIYCYCLMLAADIFLAGYLKDIRNRGFVHRIFVIATTGCVNAFIPVLFYYFTFGRLDKKTMSFVAAEALLLVLFVWLVYPWLIRANEKEEAASYEMLLEDEYPLLADMRRYSMVEYQHGRKVSRLAELCGREIGVSELTCAVGGMYYRLGKMEGPPEIENAVKVAANRCFPPDVIAILEEYAGKKRLPQTPESAIVHMVDTLVTKLDLMSQDMVTSSWNASMVIYQTLNEFSNQGIYDEAKLSMNQFLRIREKLVQTWS